MFNISKLPSFATKLPEEGEDIGIIGLSSAVKLIVSGAELGAPGPERDINETSL